MSHVFIVLFYYKGQFTLAGLMSLSRQFYLTNIITTLVTPMERINILLPSKSKQPTVVEHTTGQNLSEKIAIVRAGIYRVKINLDFRGDKIGFNI